LEAFDQTRPSLSLTEIAMVTGLDKSAAQRFANTLYVLGYLRKDRITKRYSLSPKAMRLGFSYLRTDSVVGPAMSYLRDAARRTEETVNLTELDDTEVVYVARVPSRHATNIEILLGTRLPAYCTAPGRAMLGFLSDERALDILGRSELKAHTPHTVTDRDKLLDLLRQARREGYALVAEQIFAGEYSVAAPIFSAAGEPTAAVNIAVPASRWSVADVKAKLLPVVLQIAQAVSQTHGTKRPEPRMTSRTAAAQRKRA
ncbi:MAG: helix-turn-helix domain-containing protein, partial [Alphaproteobacteria bacterium]|nr:helix-turn-helix domain-containing protein [Alphaproteobacteria bacterium]